MRTLAEEIAKVGDAIELLEQQTLAAPDMHVLRAIEGMAARNYWHGFIIVLPEVGFEGRQRRPPPDLVNAALGDGYAILLGECVAALRSTSWRNSGP